MGLPMLTKQHTWAFLTVAALVTCGSARGDDSTLVAKPILPPPNGEIVTQSYIDDAPLYNPGNSSPGVSAAANGSAGNSAAANASPTRPNGSNNSANSKPPQPMTANEMVRRHLGTPQVVPSGPQRSTNGWSFGATKPASVVTPSTNVPAEPTVSRGEPRWPRAAVRSRIRRRPPRPIPLPSRPPTARHATRVLCRSVCKRFVTRP